MCSTALRSVHHVCTHKTNDLWIWRTILLNGNDFVYLLIWWGGGFGFLFFRLCVVKDIQEKILNLVHALFQVVWLLLFHLSLLSRCVVVLFLLHVCESFQLFLFCLFFLLLLFLVMVGIGLSTDYCLLSFCLFFLLHLLYLHLISLFLPLLFFTAFKKIYK